MYWIDYESICRWTDRGYQLYHLPAIISQVHVKYCGVPGPLCLKVFAMLVLVSNPVYGCSGRLVHFFKRLKSRVFLSVWRTVCLLKTPSPWHATVSLQNQVLSEAHEKSCSNKPTWVKGALKVQHLQTACQKCRLILFPFRTF